MSSLTQLDNIVVLGCNSAIYRALKPTISYYFPSIIEIDRFSRIFPNKSGRYLIINFAAPTSDSSNFSKSFDGVTFYLNFLESILRDNPKSVVVHIRSYAEFVTNLSCLKGGRIKSRKSKNYEFQALVEQPYTFWKLYQSQMVAKITSRYDVKTFDLTIPFVNFENEKLNSLYYLRDGVSIFPLSAKVPCISVRDICTSFVDLVEKGTWHHPAVCHKECYSLLGKVNSPAKRSHILSIKPMFVWFLTYILYREVNRRNRVRERLIRLVE